MKYAFAIVLAAGFMPVSGGAFAACEARGALICGSGAPQVSSEAGLSVSRGGSFTPLAAGAGLRSGDRILTGDAPSTVALGPSCRKAVGPGALISFTRSGGRTCASVTESAALPEPVGGEVGGALGSQGAVVGLATGAAIAAGIGIALSGRGSNPRPTVSAQ